MSTAHCLCQVDHERPSMKLAVLAALASGIVAAESSVSTTLLTSLNTTDFSTSASYLSGSIITGLKVNGGMIQKHSLEGLILAGLAMLL